MEEDSLFQQLHKLSGAKSEETLEEVIRTLWKTRKIGLNFLEKSHMLSLVNLASLEELDPVLACLRSLIRRCLHEISVDDVSKLFPPDLSLDLQSVIVHVLQKFQNQWKEEASKEDEPLRQRIKVSYPVKTSVSTSFTYSSSAEMSSLMWPRHDDPTTHSDHNIVVCSTTNIADTSLSHSAPLSLLQSEGSTDNMEILPCLKSMTWTVDNHNSKPDYRVAAISLKLQDYSKSPSGEMEVKFQLSRDTLDAMLRSMAYISEQLSNIAGSSSGPLQKKPRQ